MAEKRKGTEQSPCQVKRIDVLPDDILLEIFDFCVGSPWCKGKVRVEEWQLLVHVCRHWRSLVFASPRRLNLQLYCTHKTPVRDTLAIWPPLPLIVGSVVVSSAQADNVIAALEQSNRVSKVVILGIGERRQMEKILATMHVPFPELTDLQLVSCGDPLPVIPDSFLGGSVPRLQRLKLLGIPYPGLPKLFPSVTHLVELQLIDIPHTGYISPEAIATLISVLSDLETLRIGFEYLQYGPYPGSRPPPPSKRSVIPALKSLRFNGLIEYLEDLMTRIDAPQLDNMQITFLDEIDFDIPRLAQFINRTPKLTKPYAHLQFDDNLARVLLQPGPRTLEIAISCIEPDRQLSAIEQVCNSSLRPLSTVEDLYINDQCPRRVWKNDAVESTLWLQLLLPFTAVKNLYLSKKVAPGIAVALKELVGGTIIGVLPNLRNIFVKGLKPSGPFQENIGQFVAARQLSDHSITISDWDEDSDVESK